jgi:hypothetical protein
LINHRQALQIKKTKKKKNKQTSLDNNITLTENP